MNGPDRLGLRGPCHRCRSQWLTQFQLRGAQPRPGRVVSLTHYPTVTTSIVLSTLLWLKGCFVPLLVRYITLSYLKCRDAALHMFITNSALSSCSHVFGTQYLRVYTCLEAMPDRRWRTRGSTTFFLQDYYSTGRGKGANSIRQSGGKSPQTCVYKLGLRLRQAPRRKTNSITEARQH